VPVYLNELSPATIRATFPGFTYQIGNLLAAANANNHAGVKELAVAGRLAIDLFR